MPRKKKEEEPKADDNEEEQEEPEESAGEEEETTDKGKRSTRGAGRNDGKWRKLVAAMMPSSSEDEDPEVCPICEEKNDPSQPQDKKNRMIGCDGCDKWYHWSCVGIDQWNKPGKHDDWFCRRCGTKKTESGEWKPENSELNSLEVLPMREASRSGAVAVPPSPVRTLAQKKAYDPSPLDGGKKKRGRQPGTKMPKKTKDSAPNSPSHNNQELGMSPDMKNVSKISRANTPPSRTSTPDSLNSAKKKNMMRESWVTGGSVVIQKPQIMKLPPGISLGKSTEDEEQSRKVFSKSISGLGGITLAPASPSLENQDSEGEGASVRQNLESRYSNISMSINRDGPKTGIPKLPSSITIQKERDPSPRSSTPLKLPPGITLSRDDVSSKLPPGISIEKESSPSPRLPPGISIHKNVEETQRRLPPGISIQKQVEEKRPNLPPGIQISKAKDNEPTERIMEPTSPDIEDEIIENLSSPDNRAQSVSPDGRRPMTPEDMIKKADDEAENKQRGKKQKGKEKNNQKTKIKTPSIIESSDSEMEETQSPERRGTRDKSEQYARIRATLREDSLSDEDRFGDRIPYRKKGWKPQKTETPPISISPVEDAILGNLKEKEGSPIRTTTTEVKTSKTGKETEKKIETPAEKKKREKEEREKKKKEKEEEKKRQEEDEKDRQKRMDLLQKERMKIERKRSSGKKKDKRDKEKDDEVTPIDELLDDHEEPIKNVKKNNMDELSDEIDDEINDEFTDDIMEMENSFAKPLHRGRKRKSRDSDASFGSENSEKISKKGKGRKEDTSSDKSIDLTLDDDEEESPSNDTRKSRRRSGKGDVPVETSSSKDKKVLSSPVRNKPTAVVEPVRPTIVEESQKNKKRGRPSKKEKKEPIPLDVQAAMRAVNGLRERKPKTEEVSDKGVHDPKLSDLQNEIIVSPSSIKSNDKEVLKVDDKVRPQMSVKPTGSGLTTAGPSNSGDVTQDKWETVRDDSGHTKGLSLIVKSTDSKKKVSLVIKPFDANSSNEECDASAENNENSTSRPMEDGSNPTGQNSTTKRGDLLSKVIQDTIKDKSGKDVSNMYLTEEEIAKLPIDIGAQKPNTSSAIGHPNLGGVDLEPPALPQDLADVMPSLDDVLGVNKGTKSQKDEAEIQKIKNSLAADFERNKKQQQNFSAYQQQHHQQQQHQQQQQQQQQQKYMWPQNMQQQQNVQQQMAAMGHPQQQIGHYNWGQQQHPQQHQAQQMQSADHQYMKTQQPSMIQQRPAMFPNATFSNDAGVSFQPPVAGVHNLPPTVGQPPRSMPSFNVNPQSTVLPPLVPIPATSTVMSTMSQQLTSSTQAQPVNASPAQHQLPNIRAPSTDSGMGTSNNSTPTNTPTAQTTTASEPGVWDLFEKEIADFAETCDGDESIKEKDSKAGIKILKPMELNEKARGLQGETITVSDGKDGHQRQIQVTSTQQAFNAPGSIGPGGARTVIVQQPMTPTKPGDPRQIVVHMTGAGGTPTKIMVQNPGSIGLQPQIPGGVGPRMVVAGPPGPDGKVTYLYPLSNRLQGQPVATTVIRLAAPISGALTTVAGTIQNVTTSGLNTAPVMVSGTAGLGVRLPTPVSSSMPIVAVSGGTPIGVQPGQSIVVASGMAGPPQPPASSQASPVRPGFPIRMGMPGAPGSPGARPVRPIRGRGGVRMRGQIRPGMRPRMPMRPGVPGPRGMRPGGPRGIPPRGMRPGGPMRPGAPRPGAPRPGTPGTPGAVRPSAPATGVVTPTSSTPGVKAKIECVDLSDDDSPPPPPRNPTLDKLQACGISISRQKAPQVPKGLKLPPGISLSPAPTGYSSGRRSSVSSSPGGSGSYSITPANDEPSPKKIALQENVASALASAAADTNSTGPRKKVELELSEKQMEALKALGLL